MEAAFGIKTTVVPCDAQAISDALTPETKMIYAESPGSKLFNILDLEAAGQIGRSQRVLRVIDNTWATPMFQNPLAYGFDLVIHSATKFLGGHNDILGGAVIGAKGVIKRLHNLGAVMDPHQAWLLNRSLATLPMRMQRHMESAALIAAFLENHPNVARVFYPGLESHPQYELGRRQMSGYSGLLSFITAGDYDASLQMMKRFRLIKQAWSYGGPTSVAMHNGRYFKASLERMGYPPNLIRLHVGFENPEEIINDLERALNSL
jgi:cystathionine beta-lyase/cystathionine gamma-synthase